MWRNSDWDLCGASFCSLDVEWRNSREPATPTELVELALSHQPKVTNEPWHYDYPETWLRSSIFATLPGTIAILHKIELHDFETTNYFLKALDELTHPAPMTYQIVIPEAPSGRWWTCPTRHGASCHCPRPSCLHPDSQRRIRSCPGNTVGAASCWRWCFFAPTVLWESWIVGRKNRASGEKSFFFWSFFKDICIQLMTLRYYLLLVHWNYANMRYIETYNHTTYKGYKWDTLHGYTSNYTHMYLYVCTYRFVYISIFIYRCIHIWCPFKHVRSSK